MLTLAARMSRAKPSAIMIVAEKAKALKAAGVLCLPIGPRRLRLLTHLDVDRAACERAVPLFAEALK